MKPPTQWIRIGVLAALAAFASMVMCTRRPQPAPAVDAPRRAAVRHELDISELRPALDRLGLDERPDQLLDLAVYGTLIAEGHDSAVLRDVLHDAPLLRDEQRSDLLNHESDAGRRVILRGGRALLFASAYDPQPRTTLGRLADKVRVELGERPASAELWRVTPVAGRDHILVERMAVVGGDALFSAEYGYVEQRVNTREELARFLASVDDLTFVRRDAGGLTLGGRRGVSLTHATTDLTYARVELDDVATLYRAQQELVPRVVPLLDASELAPLLRDAFHGMVDAYNNGVRGGVADAAPFDRNARTIASSLHLQLPQTHATLEAQRGTIELVAPRLRDGLAELDRRADEAEAALERQRQILDVGFSLDPAFHARGLVEDLNRIVSDPAGVVREARELDHARGTGDPEVEGGTSVALAARRLAAAVAPGAESEVAEEVAPRASRVREAIAAVEAAADDRDAVSRAARSLERDVSRDASTRGTLLTPLVRYALARQEVQCARYDGQRLQGTRAGMTLFYCDLLAKTWGTLEHPGDPPINSIVGFQSVVARREFSPASAEDVTNTSTRVWFGPRPDAAAQLPRQGGIVFQPWFTRMFAASSDPTRRGKEGVPDEPERAMVSWWNRNLQRIADFEPQYHRQNQLLKWSSAAAFMVRHGLLPDLATVAPQPPQDFGQWLQVAGPTLRGAQGIRVLDRGRWIAGTECIDILTSRTQREGGLQRWLEGGVDGGGLRTVRDMRVASADLPEPRRRAGVDPVVGQPDVWKVPARELRVQVEQRGRVEAATVSIDDEGRQTALSNAGRPVRIETTVTGPAPDPAHPAVQQFELSQKDNRDRLLALVATRHADGRVKFTVPETADLGAHGPRGPPRPPNGPPPIESPSPDPEGFERDLDAVHTAATEGGSGGTPRNPPGRLLAGFYEESRRNAEGAKTHYERAFDDGIPGFAGPVFERYARQHGFEVGEYARIRLGGAAVPDGSLHSFSLAPHQGQLYVSFAIDPSIPQREVSASEVLIAYRAARRGGDTDVYPEVLVDDARLANQFDFVAHPIESITSLHGQHQVSLSRVDVGLRVGTAHFTLAQRGDVRYVRVLGRAPGRPSEQRAIYLVDARGGAN